MRQWFTGIIGSTPAVSVKHSKTETSPSKIRHTYVFTHARTHAYICVYIKLCGCNDEKMLSINRVGVYLACNYIHLFTY